MGEHDSEDQMLFAISKESFCRFTMQLFQQLGGAQGNGAAKAERVVVPQNAAPAPAPPVVPS